MRSACSGTSLPARAVVLDDRLGLGVVGGEPPRDHLGGVVGAVLLDARGRASARSRRRRAGRRRGPRRAGGRCPPSISSSASACASLRGKPSRTNPPARRLRASRSRISAIVSSSGTSAPLARIGSTSQAELGPGGDRRAEHVAGRDVRDRVVGRDPLGLRALARTLRAQHEQVHAIAGTLRRTASSSATPSAASCRARRRRRSAPRCRRARARSPARSRT